MAVLRARSVAVATGVPALFALLAGILTVAVPNPVAQAEEVAAAPAVVRPPLAIAPFATTRALPQPGYRPIPVTDRIRTADQVAFITIDDGVHKDPDALAFVEERQLPVTAFLSAWTIKDQAEYFTRITAWGSIQNHSATHASFADETTDLNHEICYSQRAMRKAFGSKPWMLRPPYGAGADRFGTVLTAQRCGIREIVMWDATVSDGKVRLATGELHPGSILLLHFGPDLARDLKAAVRAIRDAGLAPGRLADYLPTSTPEVS